MVSKSRIAELLDKAAAAAAAFLGRLLPADLGDRWWDVAVLSMLTNEQRGRAENEGLKQLEELDLAALIRLVDANWFRISPKIDVTPESRHFVREMRSVRNRWAHSHTNRFPAEDVYRDLDTLVRFLAIVDADPAVVEEAAQERARALDESRALPDVKSGASDAHEGPSDSARAGFEVGRVVCLQSDPSTTGAILRVHDSVPEARYDVFVDGETRTFYASQLSAETPDPDRDKLRAVGNDSFHALLTATQIQQPSLSTLYSLNSARVDFIPYQFRPVLKFIRADRPRLLIADSVGVGKTIEAGLILKELQARRDVQSVLIICPRPLVAERKWVVEMKRFDERFSQLDGPALRACISEADLEGEWPDEHLKAIVPYSLFDEELLYGQRGGARRRRPNMGLVDLDPPPRFDLVIVDEAHHVRNPATFAHEAVRFFCDNADAVLFLTATPLQLGDEDLFVLLNLLRPDLVLDRESFEHMTAPNPYLNAAVDAARAGGEGWPRFALQQLDHALSTDWGRRILSRDPDCDAVRQTLGSSEISDEERIGVATAIEGLHTLSGVINRTRRRDIGEFTVREPHTVEVHFSQQQRELHDRFLSLQAEILKRVQPDHSINFMMSTLRRQASSCLSGLAPLARDILSRRLDEIPEFSSDLPEGIRIADAFREAIEEIGELAGRLVESDDPKVNALLAIVEEKQSAANNKIMVFSSFRHTLNYLQAKMASKGVRVAVVHGGTPDLERVELRDRFRRDRGEPDALDVLLFSEVGCEGLDYQFCDCLVNYDIPWNPMRLEQRIGRIDRKGQKSEKVRIYNLITPGTVDADIYDRCMMRIGIFNSAIGGSEEILGSIAKEVQAVAADVGLSDVQRCEKLQQIADNKIRLVQERQELEDKQLELFGLRLPAQRLQSDIEAASSYWLSPRALQNLVSRYLQQLGAGSEHLLGDGALKTLRLSQDLRRALLDHLPAEERVGDATKRQWVKWLRGGDPHLQVVFESAAASENPSAIFINPMHPLCRQAATSIATDRGDVVSAFAVEDDELSSGNIPFAIYEWTLTGVVNDLALYPVCAREDVTSRLNDLLEVARAADLGACETIDDVQIEALYSKHYEHWGRAKQEHTERVGRLAERRRESLRRSHQSRIAVLEEQLEGATNARIRKMREAQVNRAEADFQAQSAELDRAVQSADVTSRVVGYGVLVVNGG